MSEFISTNIEERVVVVEFFENQPAIFGEDHGERWHERLEGKKE